MARLLKQVHHLPELPRAQEGIHFGEFFKNLIPVLLDEASRHDQFFAFRFHLPSLQNGVDGLFFRSLDERAGVDNDGVGFRGIGYNLMAARFQYPRQVVGVSRVFGAAERHDGYFFHKSVMWCFLRSAVMWLMTIASGSLPSRCKSA